MPKVPEFSRQSVITYDRFEDFENNQLQISKNHVSRRAKEVKCEKLILHKGKEIITKYPLWGELLKTNKEMLLSAFQEKLETEANNSIESWAMIWRSHIISEIQDILKEEHRFFVTERKLYDEDKLKKVITKFELLFNTVIRQNIFEGSIQIYMDFLRKYVVPSDNTSNLYIISSTPLIVLQLNVNPIKQKTKKKSKRDHKEVKEQLIEEDLEEIIFYEPNLETIEDTLTIPFDILHRFSMNFNKLEKDLLPLLNM